MTLVATTWLRGDAPQREPDTPPEPDDESTTEEEETLLACSACSTVIARPQDAIAMGPDGTIGVFANPAGLAFEIQTFATATHLLVASEPTVQWSWYRGHAWSVVVCDGCHSHLGWRFTAVAGDASPARFFGLLRARLVRI